MVLYKNVDQYYTTKVGNYSTINMREQGLLLFFLVMFHFALLPLPRFCCFAELAVLLMVKAKLLCCESKRWWKRKGWANYGSIPASVLSAFSEQLPLDWGSVWPGHLTTFVLTCRVRLSKRRAKAGAQSTTNAVLVCKHRDMNEKELEAQVSVTLVYTLFILPFMRLAETSGYYRLNE